MKSARPCIRPGCDRPAAATLTYVYKDSSMIIGPLAMKAVPHTYDLCAEHAQTITAPAGWDVIRLQTDYRAAEPTHDDLSALADAVLQASKRAKPYIPPERRRLARPVTERAEHPPRLHVIKGDLDE
ncbi:MAG: DUF3499 domain-containing protein [Bowdeniella nasicola]|nr:DUF3499 domain-containing protein [Bowdeniella nasicola]